MAEKTLNTRILLRYDEYSVWTSKNPVLKAGEVAIATIKSGNTQEVNSVTPPQVLIKVGNGTDAYNALPFVSAKAADVYSWAKESNITITKDGTGNVVSGITWDASLNNGKGGIKFTTAAVATAEGLGELQATVAGISKDIADNRAAWAKDDNTTYTFAKSTDGKGIVVTPSSGNASTISFAFLTEAEVKAVIEGYKYATEKALNDFKTEVGNTYVTKTAFNTHVGEFEQAVGDLMGDIGEVSMLATTAQTSTVAAINELHGRTAALEGVDVATKKYADDAAAAAANGKDGAIAAAKKAGDDAQTYAEGVLGTAADAATANTVYGAKAAAAAAQKAADDAQGDVNTLELEVGDVDSLGTSNKTVVSAINEVLAAVGAGGTAAAITITKSNDGLTYTVKQGDTLVGTIDIPKDMVVTAGEVVTNPAGQPAGTYIKLTLANVKDPLYINVGNLVDIYKAKANAAQVQVAIDSATREISASIVAGSIGATELADGAVTTAKIADANVTKAKLAATVQASLDKADSALQSHQSLDHLATKTALADVVSGTTPVAKATNADIAAKASGLNESGIAAVKAVKVTNAVYAEIAEEATHADNATNADKADNADKLGGQLPSHYATTASVTDITKDGGTIDEKIHSYVGQLPQGYTEAIRYFEDEIGAAKKHASDLDTAMDSRVDLLEGDRHNHTNKEELDKIASGNVAEWNGVVNEAIRGIDAGVGLTAKQGDGTSYEIDFDDKVTFIFNCGGAEI